MSTNTLAHTAAALELDQAMSILELEERLEMVSLTSDIGEVGGEEDLPEDERRCLCRIGG